MIASAFNWQLGPGRADFFPPGEERPLIPVLIRLRDGINPKQFAALASPWLHVPVLYTDILPELDPRFESLAYITAVAELAFFDEIAKEENKALADAIEDIALGPPLQTRSRADRTQNWTRERIARPLGPPAAKTVVLGIVDDGIAFAHEAFREAGGSRVEFFWMQDGPPPGPIGLFGPFANGRELRKQTVGTQKGIDEFLVDSTHVGLVDEDELYRLARVLDPEVPVGRKAIQWRRAHGTHVLDLACNFPIQEQPDRRIIAVQVPIEATALRAPLLPFIVDGIFYVLVRSLLVSARLGCGPLPAVINVSYGITTGPHDGRQIGESAIDSILSLWSAVFSVAAEAVIASGNTHLERLHAEARSAAGPVDLPWRIPPDDRTPSYVEIWLPPGIRSAPNWIMLTVIAPGGAGPATISEGSTLPSQWTPAGTTLCEVSYDFNPLVGRGRFCVHVQPTARDGPGPVAPCGLWTIRLTNLASADVAHAYIARDEAPYGYSRRGRQSYFDERRYRRYDDAGRPVETDNVSLVRRASSMNGLATGGVPSVIGGFLARENQLAAYSAGGPLTRPNGWTPPRFGPDAVSVGDDSRVHGGVLAAGTRSGSVVAMDGTSVAAPRITRWISGELAAGRSGNRSAVMNLASAEEGGASPGPLERMGAGRIRLQPLQLRPRDRRFEED
jgi:hypothetical protein